MQHKKLTDRDLEPRTPKPDIQPILEALKPTELPVPIFKRSGFKRILGGIITAIGTLLSFSTKYSGIGQIVMYAGGALGLVGVGDGIRKNKKTNDKTQIILSFLRWIWEWIKTITKNGGK